MRESPTWTNNYLKIIMNLLSKYTLKYFLFFAVIIVISSSANSQDKVNLLVKVYDLQLNPVPNIGIAMDETEPFTTDSEGMAFVVVPESSIPPIHIEISDEKLEAESWNYSKGTLEVIIRNKNYRELRIKILDADYNILPGININIPPMKQLTLTSDSKGLISLLLPISIQIEDPDLFHIEGYRIVRKNINNEGGTMIIEEIIDPEESETEDFVTERSYANTKEIADNPEIQDKEDRSFDLGMENLDSITSMTVLFALMKKLNFQELDSLSKRMLDDKFNELLYDSLNFSIASRPTLELITDSSLVSQDVMILIDKIQSERESLIQFSEEFEKATEQIKGKLENGGTSLSSDERKQLIQLFLNLREMLRRNEELFYKNNNLYKQEVEALLAQITDIYELEDQVRLSEEMSRKFKKQLTYTILGLAGLSVFLVILIYFARLFMKQKNQLLKANSEIEAINDNLEGLVAEKTKSLELINKELDTFLYRSSHNLKRPLSSMRGLANIAEMTLSSHGIDLFDKVVSNAREMEKMLDKLTMMSYINQPSDFGDIDFKQTKSDILSKFSSQIEANNILLSISIQKDTHFKSYPLVVQIILQNLCENAVFFSQINQKKPPKIDVSIKQHENGGLYLSVKDNGCGIQPDIQDKIWNMFYVGHELSKGNGLGLYITKKAVESLLGTIQLNSEVEMYTEFMIHLPHIKMPKTNNKKSRIPEIG